MTKEQTLTEKATKKATDLLNKAPGASQVRDLLDRPEDESRENAGSQKNHSSPSRAEKVMISGVGATPPDDIGKITKLVRQLFAAAEVRQNRRDEDFAGDDASPVQVTLKYLNESSRPLVVEFAHLERDGFTGYVVRSKELTASGADSHLEHQVQDTEHLSRDLDSTKDLYEAMVKFLLQVRRLETAKDASLFPFDVVERLFFRFHGYDRPIPIDVSTASQSPSRSPGPPGAEHPPESEDGFGDASVDTGDGGRSSPEGDSGGIDAFSREESFDWSATDPRDAVVGPDDSFTVGDSGVTSFEDPAVREDADPPTEDQRIPSTS